MKDLKKAALLSLISVSLLLGANIAYSQDRPRVVTTGSSRPLNQPQAPSEPSTHIERQTGTRPTGKILTNDIVVQQAPKPLVKKTASSNSINGIGAIAASRLVYNVGVSNLIMQGIRSRLGIPYLYGSSGPNRYDCSGFVWSVFRDAGIDFTRVSARTLWNDTTPVTGDERYKFGTLVFMNNLGHMGIVADEEGFYHASSSKGITYSKFKGYWEKRIVGFRRLDPRSTTPQSTEIKK